MSVGNYSLTYIILCVTAVFAMFSSTLVNPLLSIYAKDIGAAGIWIGLSVSAYWISRVLLEIPSGFISTRFGYYAPMFIGLILTAIGNLLCAFVTNPIQLIFARLLMGLGAPLFFAVSMTFIINMFNLERRGSAMGLFQGVEFLGNSVASTFSGYIISETGFKGGFYLCTILAMVGFVLISHPKVRIETKAHPRSSNITLSSVPKVLTNKSLLIVCAVTIMNFILYQGVLFTTYPLYLNENLKISLTDIGLIQGTRSVGYVISMLFMGTISDRVGRKPVLLFGVFGTMVISIALNYALGFYVVAIGMFLIGFTMGAIWIICPVIAAEVVEPTNRGTAVGTYRTFFDTGSVFGPILMMWVVGAYGYSMSFFLSVALLLAAFIPTLWLKETRAH